MFWVVYKGPNKESNRKLLLTILDRKVDRKIDRNLSDKYAESMPNTSLKLPPNTRKLLISQSYLTLRSPEKGKKFFEAF